MKVVGILAVLLGIYGQVALGEEERKACHSDENNDINVLVGLPRRNFNFDKVSSDLGTFDTFVESCPPPNETEICDASWLTDFDSQGIDLVLDRDYVSANPSSWINYFQSVAMYAYVGVAFAVIAVIAGIVALCCRCCCCGGPKKLPPGVEPPEYPMWQTVATYGCLVLFLILIFTFTMLGQIRGNKGFTDAQLALVDAPDNLVALAAGISDPAVQLMTSVIGETTINLIERVNTTVYGNASIATVYNSVICAREIFDFVTNTSLVDDFLDIFDNLLVGLTQAPDVTNITNTVNGIQTQISNLNSSIVAAEGVINDLRNGINGVDLDGIESQVNALDSTISSLKTDVDTLKGKLETYVAVQSNIVATQNAASALLTATYNDGNINTFNTEYDAFKTALAAMPDEDGITTDLNNLNTTLDSVDVSFANLESAMLTADAQVQALPTITAVNNTIDNIVAALDAFDLQAVKSQLTILTDYFLQLPSIQPILDKIAEIQAAVDKIPCVFNISGIPEQVNATLIELPPEFLNFTNEFTVFNDTINNATGDLDSIVIQINDFAASFNGTLQDIANQFSSEVDSVQTVLDQAKATVQSLQTDLGTFNLGILDLSGPISELQAVRASFSSASLRPTPATVSALADAKTDRTALSNGITALDGAGFQAKLSGFIAKIPIVEQCGNSDPCYTPGSPPTLVSCGTQFECPYPLDELQLLDGLLGAFNTGINNISPNLSTEVIPLLGQTSTELAAIDFSCCTDFTALRDFQTQINSTADAITSATGNVDTISDTVRSLSDDFLQSINDGTLFNNTFAQIRTELEAFNTTTLLDPAQFEQIDTILDKIVAVHDLLVTDLALILNDIRKPVLDGIAESSGIAETIKHVARQFDKIIGKIEPSQANIEANLTDFLDPLRVIDAARDKDGSVRAVGSIYYLVQMVNAANNQTNGTVGNDLDFGDASAYDIYDTPTVLGFIENGRLVDYPDGSKCVTDECIRNSIEFYNNDDINNIAPEDLNDIVSLPMSRTTAMAVPFIIPGFLMIMTVMVFFMPACGYAVACCSVCVMPWLFVICGGIFFPMLILTADVCASAESVGISTIRAIQPVLCESVNGTISTEGFCVFNISQPPLIKTVELDAPELFESILLQCGGSSTANVPGGTPQEPVKAFMDSFGLEAGLIVQAQMIELLDKMLPESGIILRSLLRSDVLASGNDLEQNLVDLSSNLNNAIGCEPISAAYLGFKDVFCCDFSRALYWSFASWYLMAFCMLFCGLPLGCFAATRLRNIRKSREQLRQFYQQSVTVVGRIAPGQPVVDGQPVEGGRSTVGNRLRNMGNSFKAGTAKLGQSVKTRIQGNERRPVVEAEVVTAKVDPEAGY